MHGLEGTEYGDHGRARQKCLGKSMASDYLRQASYAVSLEVTVLHTRERPKDARHHILCSTLQQ